jgi:predicted TIM-barrel enzyme/AraC-like DNA-binding protein
LSTRKSIINQLQSQIKKKKNLVGVAVGSGLTASNAVKNGADIVLALSSGVYRNRGVGSLAAYLPFKNSNQLILETYKHEIAPRLNNFPVTFGLMATDPMIDLKKYIIYLKSIGLAGINNYPTVGLIDGNFRKYLEDHDVSYQKEVDAIHIANRLDLFTVGFAFNSEQIEQMYDAGADIICLHLGLTTGGSLGAKQIKSLQATNRFIQDTFKEVDDQILREKTIMIYGGPITTLNDAQFVYDNNIEINGYIGGSVFERIPTEKTLETMIESFKAQPEDNYLSIIGENNRKPEDYATFLQNYIHNHYSEEISLEDLSEVLYLSRSYLSTIFKQYIGKSFSDYLIDYRLSRATELIKMNSFSLNEISTLIGYQNYPHFSKLFKKRLGVSPNDYRNKHKHNYN